jgi:hypothetical protein
LAAQIYVERCSGVDEEVLPCVLGKREIKDEVGLTIPNSCCTLFAFLRSFEELFEIDFQSPRCRAGTRSPVISFGEILMRSHVVEVERVG